MRIPDIIHAPETRTGLFLAVAISFVIKAALLVILSDQPINRDGFLYVAAAQKFAQVEVGQALALFPLPLFPLLIAGVHLIVPDWLLAGRLVSLLALLLSLVPLYLITRELFGPRAAFFAGLAAALAPYSNEFVIAVNRGAVYLCFLTWAVYFAQRAVGSPRPAWFVLAAVFSAAAGLCRFEGGVFVVMCTFFFCICLLRASAAERQGFIKGIAAWAAVFAVPLLVSVAVLGPESFLMTHVDRFRDEFGKIVQLRFLDNYHQLYAQLEIMGEASPYPSGNQNFAEIARHYIPVIYLMGLLEILVVVMFPLFVVGLLAGIRHRSTRSSGLILWCVGCYLVFIYYSHLSRDFIQTRFLFAPAFLLYPWVGLGLERIWDRLRRTGRSKWLCSLFVGVFFISALIDTAYTITRQDPIMATAGRWVDGNRELSSARKFLNDGRLAFHAGQSWQEFRLNEGLWQAENLSIEDFARKHGIEVVVRYFHPGKGTDPRYDFISFLRWKIFEGRKYAIEVYAVPELGAPQENVSTEGQPLPQRTHR